MRICARGVTVLTELRRAHVLRYEALLVNQQGSALVEGTIVALVTAEGTGLILEAFHARGDGDRFDDDFTVMATSVVTSVSAATAG